MVTVQFRPQTAQTTGVKNATVSVTDLGGTQTSTFDRHGAVGARRHPGACHRTLLAGQPAAASVTEGAT